MSIFETMDYIGLMLSEDTLPLYQKIADRVEAMIESGSLRAGDRIPSVRHSSFQHHVSVPTVMQAYALLESRRLIEARPKSGFYVKARLANALREPVMSVRKPAVRSLADIGEIVTLVQDITDPTLVPLGAAIPGDDLLPLEKLAKLSGSIARRNPSASYTYDPAPGALPLRRELARLSLDWGCALDADEFVITIGASEAMHLALLAVTKPGDTVLVESPVYYGTLNLLSRLNLKVIAVPSSSNEGLDMGAVKKVLETHSVGAILVIPNFSNPLGSFMPEINRRYLLELSSRHGVPIIEDDIYGDLPHQGPRPHSLKSLEQDNQVILCGSYSKTLSPGLRIGYIVPGKYHRQVVETKNAFNLGGSPLAALTVAEFLRTGGYERHLRKLRQTYRDQVCKMREAVAALFPEGTRVSNPSGGFVLWVELPNEVDIMQVFRKSRAMGINFAPGPMFSSEGLFQNCMRLSCGTPWNRQIEDALEQLAKLVRETD